MALQLTLYSPKVLLNRLSNNAIRTSVSCTGLAFTEDYDLPSCMYSYSSCVHFPQHGIHIHIYRPWSKLNIYISSVDLSSEKCMRLYRDQWTVIVKSTGAIDLGHFCGALSNVSQLSPEQACVCQSKYCGFDRYLLYTPQESFTRWMLPQTLWYV